MVCSCAHGCAGALLWCSGSSWLTYVSLQSHIVSKQAVVTVPSQHPCAPLLGGRAASTAVTRRSISYSLAFVETVLYKKILHPNPSPAALDQRWWFCLDLHFCRLRISRSWTVAPVSQLSQSMMNPRVGQSTQNSWDRNLGDASQAASEMGELQTALSEGELTLANSACWLFFSLSRKVCEKQKDLFLLLFWWGAAGSHDF